jgi:hypothetical protein
MGLHIKYQNYETETQQFPPTILKHLHDQRWSKHVVQCIEALKYGLKDTLCVCKTLLNKF